MPEGIRVACPAEGCEKRKAKKARRKKREREREEREVRPSPKRKAEKKQKREEKAQRCPEARLLRSGLHGGGQGGGGVPHHKGVEARTGWVACVCVCHGSYGRTPGAMWNKQPPQRRGKADP